MFRQLSMQSEKGIRTTGGLAIWRRDEYYLGFLFAVRLRFWLTNNGIPTHRQAVPLAVVFLCPNNAEPVYDEIRHPKLFKIICKD